MLVRLGRIAATTTVLVTASVPLALLSVSPASAAAPTCHGHRATIVAKPDQVAIHGTSHRDVIVGNDKMNVIYARGGDDLVCARTNADVVAAGPGDDRVWGQAGADRIRGNHGDDRLHGGGGHGLYGVNSLTGGRGDDVLDAAYPGDQLFFYRLGHSAPPVHVSLSAGLATGQGHDVITRPGRARLVVYVPPGSLVHGTDHADGFGGNGSTFYGGKGRDTFTTGSSRMYGGAGNDIFEVTGGVGDAALALHAGPGDDLVTGDTVVSISDSGVLDGGSGNDFMSFYVSPASSDSDPYPLVTLDLAAQELSAPDASMPVTGFEGLWVHLFGALTDAFQVEGTDGPDQVRVDAFAPTTVHALGGDDQITTGTGDDTVDGGDGDDTADTGEGNDICSSVEHATDCETSTP